jgi:autotransporter-associated beta strand protein
VANNQVLAQAHSPMFIRNNNSGSSTLQLDGSAASITLPQALVLSGRSGSIPALENVAGTNALSGGISLNVGGANYMIQSDAGLLTLGGTLTSVATGARTFTFQGSGNVSVPGQLADGSATLSVSKLGSGTLTLGALNTYHGTTTVSGGQLLVNGSLGAGAVTVAGGLLGGTGTLAGPVALQAGGTLSPGNSAIGTLTINNALTLRGATFMKLSKAAGTNDRIIGLTSVSYGGALVVTNLAGTLGPGDAFTLFQAGLITDSFSSYALPPLDLGLAWNTAALAKGVLSVVPTNPPNLACATSGSSLTISWPQDHTGWRLLVQTNKLNLGLSLNPNDWTAVPGSAQTNRVAMPLSPSLPAEFYRLVFP